MKKYLSLPPNIISVFHDLTGLPAQEYYCTCDPRGHKLGSGGGTAWLLASAHADEAGSEDFGAWLAREPRILLHAGGQSRRLPAYAPSGKLLTPVPVFRWKRGQRIGQTLLDLQLPLYERIMDAAPASLRTLVVSGDVLVRAGEGLTQVPEADVVCFGLWGDPAQVAHHGAFCLDRHRPDRLDYMLQKPSAETQAALMQTHLILMDIGVWLLSDRAVLSLMRRTRRADNRGSEAATPGGHTLPLPAEYDLYSDLGCALGEHPSKPDPLMEGLTVAIVPLPDGEFYHYGTSHDLIASTVAIQNRVQDQRRILQRSIKTHSSVITQNTELGARPAAENESIWIENACIGRHWQYSRRHVITGIPRNDWRLRLSPGQCLDLVPLGEHDYALRPYGFGDPFRGAADDPATQYLEQPLAQWLSRRGLTPADLCRAGTPSETDLQEAALFPVSDDLGTLERLARWFLATDETPDPAVTELWKRLPRRSATELADEANLFRLFAARRALQEEALPTLAAHWPRSVFYQVNLKDLAGQYAACGLSLPPALPDGAPLMTRIHDAMFRSEALRASAPEAAADEERRAFDLLREGLTQHVLPHRSRPHKTTCDDQIVWARSSARIDLAGGWTDTPPYSLTMGGNVVNLALEMNGQPPLQVYVKPAKEPVIICRSIDLGAMERIETYDELSDFTQVGSPFSIPKAALALAGFLPRFCAEPYESLREQLLAFGCGLEITLLAAIPAGSGLGTSSILAATVLGALSDFCGLAWDRNEVCNRTLVLEQLLTTGGGWQDQYGGVFEGVKLLQTTDGFDQNAVIRWLPDTLFTAPELRPCHLLYYTGLTRTAKDILAEIVRGMFLNSTRHLDLLDSMRRHALDLFDAIQKHDIEGYGRGIRTTWQQNKALDAGTAPPLIEALCRRIDDLCLGYKLPGAGGGGFLYMMAKDAEAARRIRRLLTDEPATPRARFVEMDISQAGLQVSRS